MSTSTFVQVLLLFPHQNPIKIMLILQASNNLITFEILISTFFMLQGETSDSASSTNYSVSNSPATTTVIKQHSPNPAKKGEYSNLAR